MINEAPALEVTRLGHEATVVTAAASRIDSRSRSTIWKMLFQMPKVVERIAART